MSLDVEIDFVSTNKIQNEQNRKVSNIPTSRTFSLIVHCVQCINHGKLMYVFAFPSSTFNQATNIFSATFSLLFFFSTFLLLRNEGCNYFCLRFETFFFSFNSSFMNRNEKFIHFRFIMRKKTEKKSVHGIYADSAIASTRNSFDWIDHQSARLHIFTLHFITWIDLISLRIYVVVVPLIFFLFFRHAHNNLLLVLSRHPLMWSVVNHSSLFCGYCYGCCACFRPGNFIYIQTKFQAKLKKNINKNQHGWE